MLWLIYLLSAIVQCKIFQDQKDFLIELVEEKPVLWDPTNSDYPILSKKQAEWLSIDNSFGDIYPSMRFGGVYQMLILMQIYSLPLLFSVPLLKKVWENLTHTHRTTRLRVEGKSGDGAEDVEPAWKFWEKMAFLRSINTYSDQQ